MMMRSVAASCLMFAATYVLATVVSAETTGISAHQAAQNESVTAARQQADYHHVLFVYFQHDYQTALGLIDKGFASHGFTALSADDLDRIALMQGASQLHLGLYEKAQSIFLGLLDKASSEYVIAQTWYWLAKTGFENKQQDRSEQAYAAIQSQDLVEHLSFAQWQELTYLAAQGRMSNGSDWQPLFEQLHKSTIFPAYLQANHAIDLFNQAKFEQSASYFVNAKQSLLTHQHAQNSVIKSAQAFTLDAMHYLSPWNWFSSDPNRLAQQVQENEAQVALEMEQNALFDQINLFLGYALLQQRDDQNAREVIKQVSGEDIKAKDALLSLGWAYAQESNWTDAMATWQYLSENDAGHYQLQASYALAYGFQQQGDVKQAYYALDRTVGQIESSIAALNAFSTAIHQIHFLDDYNDAWPLEFQDLKRLFLTSESDENKVDTHYFLSVRQQSKEILNTLQDRQQQLAILESMLEQRESSFSQRGQSLALSSPEQRLVAAKQQIEQLRAALTNQSPQDKQALMLAMLSEEDTNNWSRLQGASSRHARLLKEPPRGKPLKKSYAERLDRINGIIQWQMEDTYITESWRHKRMLAKAEDAYEEAKRGLASVKAAQARSPELERDRQRINTLKQDIAEHSANAQNVYEQTDGLLIAYLSSIVDARKAELEKQWVNARLARIRLQDMQTEQAGIQAVSLNSMETDNDPVAMAGDL